MRRVQVGYMLLIIGFWAACFAMTNLESVLWGFAITHLGCALIASVLLWREERYVVPVSVYDNEGETLLPAEAVEKNPAGTMELEKRRSGHHLLPAHISR